MVKTEIIGEYNQMEALHASEPNQPIFIQIAILSPFGQRLPRTASPVASISMTSIFFVRLCFMRVDAIVDAQ